MAYHVRRKDKEITDPEAMRAVLKSTKYVTIALCRDNQPYLVTLSHGYDENQNCIYFHCAPEGKKIDYLKANNSVWGQAIIDQGYVEGKCNQLYTSVHFSGKVTFLEKIEDKLQAAACMIRQLERDPEPMIAKFETEERIKRLEKTAMCRIDITYMSGKKPEKEKP
jgi:nitroimidazol reductase NimA-like FMN-containing flavoprotein (pyridoxamine 5'-phosphate oxidase superfamily)